MQADRCFYPTNFPTLKFHQQLQGGSQIDTPPERLEFFRYAIEYKGIFRSDFCRLPPLVPLYPLVPPFDFQNGQKRWEIDAIMRQVGGKSGLTPPALPHQQLQGGSQIDTPPMPGAPRGRVRDGSPFVRILTNGDVPRRRVRDGSRASALSADPACPRGRVRDGSPHPLAQHVSSS